MPAEESDESKFLTNVNVQMLWLPYRCKLKNNLIYIGIRIWCLEILDYFAVEDFTNNPSSMANQNVALRLNFAHLVPEDQLEARLFSVIFLLS